MPQACHHLTLVKRPLTPELPTVPTQCAPVGPGRPGFETSGVGDAVDTFDCDQGIVINNVNDPVLADSQPVIVASMEGFGQVRVLS